MQDKFLVSFSKANRGLIAFREFKITAAKESYGSAISGFRSIGDFVNEANALAYFAFESIKINDKQAREVLRRAVDATIKSKRAVVARHILKKIFKSSEVRNWITTEQLKQISSGAKLEVNDAND